MSHWKAYNSTFKNADGKCEQCSSNMDSENCHHHPLAGWHCGCLDEFGNRQEKMKMRRLFEEIPGQPMTDEGFEIANKLEEQITRLLTDYDGVDLRDFQAVVSGCFLTPIFKRIISERLR